LLPVIDRALKDHPSHDIGSVSRGIAEGRFQFWPGAKSFMVTEIVQYEKARAIQAWLAAGDLDELLAIGAKVEIWGRDRGCTRAEIAGRPGWVRALRDKGYEHYTTVLTKEL